VFYLTLSRGQVLAFGSYCAPDCALTDARAEKAVLPLLYTLTGVTTRKFID